MTENTLIAVPRSDGKDLHLKTGEGDISKENLDWDYLRR
jgi:hypothetical protein